MNEHPLILLRHPGLNQKETYRLDQAEISIGRGQENFIVLSDKKISRKHTVILRENGQYFVQDAKSNNGTKLNQTALKPLEKILLKPGDRILIADYELEFTLPSGNLADDLYEITDTDLLEVKMVKKLLQAIDKESAPSLESLENQEPKVHFVFEGKNQDVVIGRDPTCELHIDSTVISRKHVRVEKRFETITVYDLESKNGTFVNRERITQKKLRDGDIIHLGTLGLLFRNPLEISNDLSAPVVEAPSSRESQSSSKPLEKPISEPIIVEEAPETSPLPPPSESRASSKSTGMPSHSISPSKAAAIPPKPSLFTRFSPVELIAIGLGLLVLIGSLWGLIKIL